MNITKQRKSFKIPCNKQLDEPWFKNNQYKGKGIVFLDNAGNMRVLFKSITISNIQTQKITYFIIVMAANQ